MSLFSVTLILKIVITPILAVPMLVCSEAWLRKVSKIEATKDLFRLYSVSLLALTLSYIIALSYYWDGRDAAWILPIGLLSNGGAALVIATLMRGWRRILGVGVFGTISVLLALVWMTGASG